MTWRALQSLPILILSSPMLEWEKPEFIRQSTLLPWRYSFLVELREFCMLLARGSQPSLVSLYSFTVIWATVLKWIFTLATQWTGLYYQLLLQDRETDVSSSRNAAVKLDTDFMLSVSCAWNDHFWMLVFSKETMSVISIIELVYAHEKQSIAN